MFSRWSDSALFDMPANSSKYWSSSSPEYEMTNGTFGHHDGYSRHRVDPWDLENYAYIHELHMEYGQHQQPYHHHKEPQFRRRDSLEFSSEPSSFGDPAEPTSSFYYTDLTPGARHHVPSQKFDSFLLDSGDYGSRYARIEEVFPETPRQQRQRCQIHNHRPHQVGKHREAEDIYGRVSEFGLDFDDIYSQQLNGGRVSSAPVPCTHCKVPNPTISKRRVSYSYGDRRFDFYDSNNIVPPQVYDTRVENSIRFSEQKKNQFLQYEALRSKSSKSSSGKFKPDNFGLNRFGHLQIDYSYSWNNLDKYIYN